MPVQHREVQGYESGQFLSLFRGLQYLEGGAASAFVHVVLDPSAAHPTRLFQLKGQRNVRATQLPLATASLNQGDVFVLDGQLGGRALRRTHTHATDTPCGCKLVQRDTHA